MTVQEINYGTPEGHFVKKEKANLLSIRPRVR